MIGARRVVAAVAFLIYLPVAAVSVLSEARSFAWYGQLVSVDQATGTLTIRAETRENSVTYLKGSAPGDRLVVIWEVRGAAGGDAQTVLAVATPEQLGVLDHGYLTPVEYVATDPVAKTITFKVNAPEAVLQVAASTPPGRWLKVTAPMDQSGPNAVLSAATPTEKPAPKPRTSPRAGATVPARASVPILPTVKANGGISGSWELRYKDQLSSTHYMACELAQDGPLVGGSCETPGRGTSPVRGEASGSDFTLQIPPGGLVYAGTVDAAGTIIRGTLVYLGVELDFEATKTTE